MFRDNNAVTAPLRGNTLRPSYVKQTPVLSKKTEQVRLEIDADRLRRLLKMGALCAADFHCLDCESKQCVWRLLLMNCEKNLNAETGCNSRCSECGRPRAGTKRGSEISALIHIKSVTAVKKASESSGK